MKPLLLLTLSAGLALAQGPLDPAAAPAPSMKTLDQIEARTPIPASPNVPIAGPHFIITAPGSYYLTGNITVSTGDGIRISTPSDVTLDLNGFTISSTLTGSALGNAISLPGSTNRISIRNGNLVGSTTVSDSGVVVAAGFLNGIYGGAIYHSTVAQIRVSGVGGTGIYLDFQGDASHCSTENCGNIGIYCDTITACTADHCINSALYGINLLNSNGTSINGNGIANIKTGNVTNCTGASTSGIGIYVIGNITNSNGTSSSGIGLSASGNATNCIGYSLSGADGMYATGTATNCRATRNGGTALNAAIAIGCTSGGGSISSPQKFLGTP